MIPVICHTNIDCCKGLEWPKTMATVPNVGDLIVSKTPLNGGCVVELEVCQITWKYCVIYEKVIYEGYYPHIELHLPKRWLNIPYFENWFNYHNGRIPQEIYIEREQELAEKHYKIYNFDGSLKPAQRM